jgi:membrane protein DedA with SNARE-associated domain
MEKNHYETALLLASGAALGQVTAILTEMSASIWSFIPITVLIFLFGYISLKKISDRKSLVHSGVKTRLVTGIWIFLVWDLFRRRFLWPIDILKFLLLVLVLYFLYRVVKRRWEEQHAS